MMKAELRRMSGRLSGAIYPVDEDGNVLGPPLVPWELPVADVVRIMLLPEAGVGVVVERER